MTKKSELWANGWGLGETGQKQYRLLNKGLISHEKFWREMEEVELYLKELEHMVISEMRRIKVLNRFLLIMAFLAGFLLGL